MVARFSPIKGQHVFVDAVELLAPRYPDAEFVLAGAPLFGEDGYARSVRNQATGSLIGDRIRFLNFVEDVPRLLDSLDVVVHASLYAEGFGQTVAEAMLAGKAVVASSAGGPGEIIEDGVTGLLVPPGDAQALANAIDDLLSDPERAREMGRLAREAALERYDIRKTTQSIEAVYEKVLARA
jgi:glycosyltransferase involved in cell wall biosynthesis